MYTFTGAEHTFQYFSSLWFVRSSMYGYMQRPTPNDCLSFTHHSLRARNSQPTGSWPNEKSDLSPNHPCFSFECEGGKFGWIVVSGRVPIHPFLGFPWEPRPTQRKRLAQPSKEYACAPKPRCAQRTYPITGIAELGDLTHWYRHQQTQTRVRITSRLL